MKRTTPEHISLKRAKAKKASGTCTQYTNNHLNFRVEAYMGMLQMASVTMP